MMIFYPVKLVSFILNGIQWTLVIQKHFLTWYKIRNNALLYSKFSNRTKAAVLECRFLLHKTTFPLSFEPRMASKWGQLPATNYVSLQCAEYSLDSKGEGATQEGLYEGYFINKTLHWVIKVVNASYKRGIVFKNRTVKALSHPL